MNRFFDGVSSILKSEGTFCYTDAFSEDQLWELEYSNFDKNFTTITEKELRDKGYNSLKEYLNNKGFSDQEIRNMLEEETRLRLP